MSLPDRRIWRRLDSVCFPFRPNVLLCRATSENGVPPSPVSARMVRYALLIISTSKSTHSLQTLTSFEATSLEASS